MKIFKLFPDPNDKIIKSMQGLVEQIGSFEPALKKLSDEEIKSKSVEFRERLKKGKTLDDLLPEAFATVREAAWRVLKQRHFDVQLIGGIVLHRGEIAEMKTGEGKTLVATLPLYLNALEEKGVHLITVNDYLARLGAGWMAPVFHFLGMSTGVIVNENAYLYDPEYTDSDQYDERLKHFRSVPRREAYYADVTYGTNNEFGFDYLRDNMIYTLDQAVQRSLNYAIVDEIDSILIDEARTPLIISAMAEENVDKYAKFSQIVANLEEDKDYNIDEKMRAATLTENGINKVEKILGIGNIYVEGGVKEVLHLEQALKARVLFKRDKDYVVKDNEIMIVDEFTGRLMPGRRYSEGLHQAIEAKEGVKVQKESQTMATITFQNLFRLYHKLSGMTGTAVTEAEEFHEIYKLETVVIPTHRPNIRKDFNDFIYRTEEDKFRAVIKDIKKRHEAGQPILIGTISIEKNELLAELMEREGLRPSMLNAKNHQKEAETIAQAGRRGAITLATNMAGRGVDIILGGNPPLKAEQEAVRQAGGLHVVGTERHESRRIDNQLRGRAGRQGDPGSSQFYVSTEDDLMRIFGGDKMRRLMETLKVPADMPIENKMISKSIESAQRKVEGNNFDTRKHLVEYDDVINRHREAIYHRRRRIIEISEGMLAEEKTTQTPTTSAPVSPAEDSSPTTDSSGAVVVSETDNLSAIILEMVKNEIQDLVHFHTSADNIADWNIKEIYETVQTIWTVESSVLEKLESFIKDYKTKDLARENIINYLQTEAEQRYRTLNEDFERANLRFLDVEKGILIKSIDELWVEHLETIDYLRQGIGLRGYGQHDPLVEYKKEAYRLYQELNGLINKQVVYAIYKTGDALRLTTAPGLNLFANQRMEKKLSFSGAEKQMHRQSEADDSLDLVPEKEKDASGKKIGRNDPCPCGSGKKYKHCHGK